MNWTLVLAASVFLCAASPPAWFSGGGLLVFAGWAAFYALITAEAGRRQKRAAYLVGLVHMLFFSFSLRHILLPAYFAVGLVGGLYYVLAALWTRALGRVVPGALAFGIAVAGVHWLRAHCVEIQYPHVQPAHCLYGWPTLLGGLAWGSEIFVNLMIGGLAAAAVDFYRAWRVGRPSLRRSAIVLTVAASGYALSLLPVGVAPIPAGKAAGEKTVRMLLFEPRLRPFLDPRTRARLMVERVVRPTLELAGPRAENPPDLVVWPESIAVHRVTGSSAAPVVHRVPRSVPWLFALAPRTRLIEGGLLEVDGGDPKVIALLVDDFGRYVGHQEKQHVVPGGEHQPFLGWLPQAWSVAVRKWFESAMGVYLPETAPGSPRPLLETADGVRFGAMICYDNAFPGVAQDLAARGAAFVLVISNENWYLGGGELQQMVAMTVCRAIEARIPIVRCTVDGATILVGADGRVRAGLPYPSANYAAGKKLEVALRIGASGNGAVPPLRPLVTWTVLLALLGLLAPLRRSWVRIKRSRSSSDEACAADPAGPVSGP